MEYQNKLSRLRHAFLRLQGQDLTQVLLRAAAKEAEGIAKNVYSTEEIFRAITDKIYKETNELSMDAKFELVSDAESLAILKKELIKDTTAKFEWEEMLFVLLDGIEGSERSILKSVLNNQHMYMLMDAGNTSAHSIAGFSNILIPIVRRIFKDFEVGKLVGVQPMSAPVGLVYLLRHRQRNDDGECEDIIDDDNNGKKISLDIVSKAIEASSHKLQTGGWTIESMQDLNSMYRLDLEVEISQALAAEIQDEITAEIMGDLHALAGDTIDVELDGFESSTPTNLAVLINAAANDIAKKTGRGCGNWVVVPPTIVSMFESLPTSVYKKKEDVKSGLMAGSLIEVGTLNGTIKVFSSLHEKSDEILVGYKGGNGDTDAGYVYAPYVPVMSSGVIVHPTTFQPVVSLMTRAGKTINGDFKYDEEGNKLDVPPKAQNYYNLIKIKGNLFTEILSSGEDS